MAEVRYNNQGGNLASPYVTSSGTTITFGAAPDFATLSGGDYIKLVLDAGTANFEIVYLTAYTAGATSGTITRAAEDSANWPAVAHSATSGPSGGVATWSCNPTVDDFSSGSSDPNLGQNPYNPVWLSDVAWALVQDFNAAGFTIPAYTYDATLGTMTASANGALVINTGSPSVGDRVVVADDYNFTSGVFVVTAVGSVSAPWVLTRSSDCNTDATCLQQCWGVNIVGDPAFGGGKAVNCYIFGAASLAAGANPALDVWDSQSLTSLMGQSIAILSGYAFGYGAFAQGSGISIGAGSLTGSGGSQFATPGASAYQGNSTAIGQSSKSAAANSTALGEYAGTYSPGQLAMGGGVTFANLGDTQTSLVFLTAVTTGNTPTACLNDSQAFQFKDLEYPSQHAIYSRTVLVQGKVVARRSDVIGTDSAWTFQGVVRGDGSSTWSWVGGSAPTPSVVAQDSGASAWSVAIAIDATNKNQLNVTVTGSAGEIINWFALLELTEVGS